MSDFQKNEGQKIFAKKNPNEKNSDLILSVQNLKKKFPLQAGFFSRKEKFVYAVNDVSFSLERGKTYGIVGESGSGKSSVAKLLVGMYKLDNGKIFFTPDLKSSALEITSLCKNDLKFWRQKIKYIFQDPGRSLNPRMSVQEILLSSYRRTKNFPSKKLALEKAASLLCEVGLDQNDLQRHPTEFSGGQRQRISIARGLICEPKILICDEVVSALDVSIQAQILNLLIELRKNRELSLVFIAHDLKVACYFCDRVGVMYCGILLEEGEAQDFFEKARHPYSRLLFKTSQFLTISKNSDFNFSANEKNYEIKTQIKFPKGCPFAPRCQFAKEICKNEIPKWHQIAPNHKVRCHFLPK